MSTEAISIVLVALILGAIGGAVAGLGAHVAWFARSKTPPEGDARNEDAQT